MNIAKVFFTCFLCCTTFFCTAQKTEAALAEVIYQFSHLRDTTKPGKFHKEEMALYVNKTSSHFFSNTKRQQDEAIRKKAAELEISGSNELNLGTWRATIPEQIFIFQKEKTLYKLTPFKRNEYLIKEPVPVITWQIKKETKKIKQYTCQKATGVWKGRNYTAWFTTDLPYVFGPWKLQGLPGLILEAEDDKKEVQFVCLSVNEKKAIAAAIQLPSKAIKTDEKSFDRMVKAGDIAPSAELADGITISGVKVQRGTNNKKKGLNNPLEKSN